MARWQELVESEPELATRLQGIFDAHLHKTLATLRSDGAPRISGIEMQFSEGELVLGMMPGSVKAKDLQRDPRLAIHSASEDPDESDPLSWPGDAKISGRARELTDPAERSPFNGGRPDGGHHVFLIDIESATTITVEGSPPQLVIRTWRPGLPVKETRRD